jgi:hypothetical protein
MNGRFRFDWRAAIVETIVLAIGVLVIYSLALLLWAVGP